MFIYLRAKDTECEHGRGREGDTHTESQVGSRLWAVSTEPDVGPKLTNLEIMTWAEVRHLTDWTTQASPGLILNFLERTIMEGK